MGSKNCLHYIDILSLQLFKYSKTKSISDFFLQNTNVKIGFVFSV